MAFNPEKPMKSPQRRILGLALLIAAAGLLTMLLARRTAGPDPLPKLREIDRKERSVVLITVDTTRADRLEPYGATDVKTPVMNRLAGQGILFEHAYAVAPITLVSHTSILTGLNPPEHGVRNNGTHYAGADLVTLPEILKEKGYQTAAFVSASVLEKRYGLDQGFDFYDDDLSTGRERHPRMVADRPAEATVASASAWLNDLEGDDPFFLWVHFYDPHAVYSPPAPYRDEYRGRLYDGEIAYMDSEIGRLLQHPRLQAEDDLMVNIIGDHGESLGEHGEQTHAILAYDATLRIPWILWMRGGPGGVRFPLPVGQVDLVPTVLEMLGMEAPEGIDGISQLPWLEGRGEVSKPLYAETYLPYYTYGWAKLRVIRQGSWKYIDAPTPELFDLSRDPYELSNLHGQLEGQAHDMHRSLEELLERAGGADREASLDLDTEAAEKLRSLGYLSVGTGAVEVADNDRPDPKEVVDLHVGLERSRRLLRDRLFDQAIEQIRTVLQRDPNNLAALIDLATALESAGEVEQAVQAIERALSLDPGYARLHLLLSGLEARRGNVEQALAVNQAALDLDPKAIEPRLQRAMQLNRLRRSKEAGAILAETLAENPEHPRVLGYYTQIVDMPAKNYEKAEERLQLALARDPFLVLVYRWLGNLYEVTKRTEEAVAIYRQGLQRQPDDAEIHARLGVLLARQSAGAEVERHLQEAIRLLEKPRAELHVSLGGWLSEQGRLEEAQEQFTIALAEEPGHFAARNNRAIAYYRTGRAEEALAELRQVTQDHPRYADAFNNLAAIQVNRGDWPDAERQARRAVELDDSLTEAWNNLGVALDEQGKMGEARKAFDRSLALAPTYWQAKFNLGVLFRKTGQYQEAADLIQEVVSQVPSYPDSHLELGRLYSGPLGDPKRARTHLNAFLRAAPGHPQAAEVRRELTKLAPGAS